MVAEEPAAPEPPRRFLLSTAVPDVRAHPEDQRAELADDVERIDRLFIGELGYRRGADLGLNPTREQLTKALRAFATAPERAPDDYVVLYLACHGRVAERSGRHYLMLADSEHDDLRGTALPSEDLLAQLWEDTPVERLLVILDTCFSEEGTTSAMRSGLEARRFQEPVTEHGSTGLVLVASSRRKEETETGALSAAFDRAVRRQATAGHAPAHISLERVMAAISSDREALLRQRLVWSLANATADIPHFLPNPRYVADAAGRRIDEIDEVVALRAGQRTAREEELRAFFIPRARGTDVATDDVWNFTGRHAALTEVTAWLAADCAAERLCVVTGDPGSGKSSLLGMVAVLSDPQRNPAVPKDNLPPSRPEPGAVDVAVNASHKTTRQLLDALAAAAGCTADSLGALTAHLQTRTAPLVVLVDSLDEALAPTEAVEELIVPLTDPARRLPLRFLVGARPHIEQRLPATARRINLDDERYADPAAVRAYTRKLLTAKGSALESAAPGLVDAVAQAVAEAADRSFLVALITARTITREPEVPDPYDRSWRDALPRLPGEAMERDLAQRLGPLADKARDLLLPLAYAQGAGLPWAGVWPRLASALAAADYTDEDVVWLRTAAGSYLVESTEDDGSVYRVYHRALIEHLRESHDAERVQRTVTEILRDVELTYVRRYLALHAAEGGVLDPLLREARFVLTADPGQLLAALPRVRTAEGRRAAQAVRDMEALLRERGGRAGADPEARARLRLAAVCRKAEELARSCDEGEDGLPWRARWAAWNPHEGPRWYEGMTCRSDTGVVVPGVDGVGAQYVEVVVGRDRQTSWDLDTGEQVHTRNVADGLHAHTWTAPAALPGTAAVLSHERRAELRGRHWVYTEWRLLHVWRGGSVRTWELPPAEDFDPAQEPLRPARQIQLTSSGPDDRTAQVAQVALRFDQGTVLIYRLQDDAAQLVSISGPNARVGEMPRITACLAPRGPARDTLLFGYEDGTVAARGDVVREAAVTTRHSGAVTALESIHDHPQGALVVTAGEDGTVRLSSLTTGDPVRTLLSGLGKVASLGVGRSGRQRIVAVAAAGGLLHRVDADSGRPLGLPLRIDAGDGTRLAVFTLGLTPCVSVQGDAHGLQVYDLVTGDRIGGRRQRHETGAVHTVDGTVCVGGSDGVLRLWPTPHAAESMLLNAHDGAVLALGEIHGAGGSHALASVGEDHEIRCWDPAVPRELWRRRILEPPPPWEVPLIACAAVGHLADGGDVVVTGEHGGRVRVLVLRAGLPLAEQEFMLPDEQRVTALDIGRVRARDVVVVGTDTGRLVCWDIGGARTYGVSLPGDAGVTALALDPDGSGRLAVGDESGAVREWALPGFRPLGPPRPVHRRGVTALAHAPGPDGRRLVSSGLDGRIGSMPDGWTRRMPRVVTALTADDAGVLCGDTQGRVWRLTATSDGWRTEEALDAPRPVSTVTALGGERGALVVVGSPDGTVQLRHGADGALRQRLRPLCESGVRNLATAPGDGAGSRLFARSEWGLLERWDVAGDGSVHTPVGTPVYGAIGERPLDIRPRDVQGGPIPDAVYGRWLIRRAGGRLDGEAWAFDKYPTGQDRAVRYRRLCSEEGWTLPEVGLVDVFAPKAPEEPDMFLVVSESRAVLYSASRLQWLLTPENRRAARVRPPGEGTRPRPDQVHDVAIPRITHAAHLPGAATYAVAGGDRLAVLGIRDGEVHHRLQLPSLCTALAVGPGGELAVGTRNGVILFD
ncbi:caspase family protein [Streptomyces bottropensis]|uniref:caspase family protein n=1 Tax=Streptomyces bottropensis TaxID=42235 RepID=UPI0036A14152